MPMIRPAALAVGNPGRREHDRGPLSPPGVHFGRWGADWGATGRSHPPRDARGRSCVSGKAANLRTCRATRPGTGLTRGFEPVTHPAWRGPGEGTEPSD